MCVFYNGRDITAEGSSCYCRRRGFNCRWGMTVRMRNSPWGSGTLGGLGLGGEAAGSPPLLSTQKKHDFNPAQHSIFGCVYLVLNIKYHV